jgi:hypothetical protein
MTVVDSVQPPIASSLAELGERFPDLPITVLLDAAPSYPLYLVAKATLSYELDQTTEQEELGGALLTLSETYVDPYGHIIPAVIRTERLAELRVLGKLLDAMRPNIVRH